MPEGPEIHRVADRLSDALEGARAEHVEFGLDRLREHGHGLSGRKVVGVEARGKAILTRFEGGRVIYSHNQLYGRWYVVHPERPPKTGRSLRLSIHTKERWALLYSASEIEVLDESELDEQPYLARLGPDLLDSRTTPARVRRRLRDERFHGRSLGALLLDQGFLGGVGNYLRSEILFFAGLRPELRPRDLDDESVARLARAAREITRRSYRTGGVTEEARFARAAKAAGEPRRTWRHAVFARAGEPCRRCERSIARIEFGGRRLYLCGRCQVAV